MIKRFIASALAVTALIMMPVIASGEGSISFIPSYGKLLGPDLGDFDGVSSGGLGFTVQGFFGSSPAGQNTAEWGIETGITPLYKYEYSFGGDDIEASVKAVPVLFLMRYSFASDGKTSPHIILGSGLYNLTFTEEYRRDTLVNTELKLGITLGLGWKAELSDGYFLDLTGRYSRISTDTDEDIEEKVSFLSFGAGIGKNF